MSKKRSMDQHTQDGDLTVEFLTTETRNKNFRDVSLKNVMDEP
jgi:hypothetical protein